MKLFAKKIMVLMIAVLMFFAAASLNANAEIQNEFGYTVTKGQATIISCDRVTKEKLTIPNKLGGFPVISIGDQAFMYCDGLTGIIIPDSVVSIGAEAFEFCTALKSITIPNSVKSIGECAFEFCSALKSISISESVRSIGDEAFTYCDGLISINVNKLNKVFASENGVLFNRSKNEIIRYPEGKTGAYTIPNNVTNIGDRAFFSCSELTSITVSNNVTNIKAETFESCYKLKSVAIPNSVASIGYRAFYETAWYDNQPNGLIYAGKVAYYYKGDIPVKTAIVLKPGTKGIAGGAFEPESSEEDNLGLIGVSIPNSVTNIGERAVANCTGLKKVTIPNTVVSIGKQALGYYIGLESAEKNPGFTINCFADTAGLKYAKENGFAYKILPASETSTNPTTTATDPTATNGTVTTTITSTAAASTTNNNGISSKVIVPTVIISTVIFLAVAVTAVLFITKRKKKKT